MPATLIVNPNAGRGRAGRLLGAIRNTFAESGVELRTIESRGPGDVEQQVREVAANRERAVIVAGGDGTINEAVNGVLATGGETALGVVPIGTGNDFAKAASIPLHWEHAAALLADRLQSTGQARPVDAGRCNGRYFANVAGIGFDAEVSAVAAKSRAPLGDAVYLLALFRTLGRLAPHALDVSLDGESAAGDFTLVSFCNGPWAGGMFQFAPAAENDDGLLDVVCVDAIRRRRIVTLLPKLLRGTHLSEPEVLVRLVRSCRIEAAEPLAWHIDGEVQEPAARFEVELLPGALRLL